MYKKSITDMVLVSLRYFFSIEPCHVHHIALVSLLALFTCRQVILNLPSLFVNIYEKAHNALVVFATSVHHHIAELEPIKHFKDFVHKG